jgi:uncharacterized protein (DUF433 family)
MALSDRIESTPQRISGTPCSVGALLDRLSEAEQAALNKMLHELGWSAARIYDALTSEGHEVGRQTIGRHRSRGCRCFKATA